MASGTPSEIGVLKNNKTQHIGSQHFTNSSRPVISKHIKRIDNHLLSSNGILKIITRSCVVDH